MRDVNSLNKVILIGRLGGNPEVRYIPQSERALARFTLATNELFYNPNSPENEVRTEWHKIVAWGKLGEFCEKFLTQGKQICIEGKLRTRNWEDKDGNKRYTTEIEAQSIVLLGKKDDGGGSSDGYSKSDTYKKPDTSDFPKKKDSPPEIDVNDDDDDIPF